ncbi:MAG: acylphosphatase [Caldiserica bacterium]|nr:MAG: acylphosphatase [Caldisericota bacterium]
MKKRIEVKIYGIVQGVGFRFYAQFRALELGIKGYVKNNFDGSVTFVGEGDEEDLKKMVEYLKKGPTGAVVQKIDIDWKEAKDEFKDFRIRL